MTLIFLSKKKLKQKKGFGNGEERKFQNLGAMKQSQSQNPIYNNKEESWGGIGWNRPLFGGGNNSKKQNHFYLHCSEVSNNWGGVECIRINIVMII